MPATTQKTYSHKSHYTLGELSLTPKRKNESRLMPGAYTPKSATIQLGANKADFKIEYNAPETPGSEIVIVEGIKVLLGKHTKKVLAMYFQYPACDRIPGQITAAAEAIKGQQSLVPQDSIKRNYQMVAEILTHLRQCIEKDWDNVTKRLSQPQPA